jgi:hypothetical protein
MTSPDERARRLLRALAEADTESVAAHEACEDALPNLIEAELAGEALEPRFATVLAHLDVCKRCADLHADLLDGLLAERAGQLPQPERLPAVVLPGPVRLRALVSRVVAAALEGLRTGQHELAGAAEAFFEELGAGLQPLQVMPATQAFGLGTMETPTLPLLLATYNTLARVAEERPRSDWQAVLTRGELQAWLDAAAQVEARRANLRAAEAAQLLRALQMVAAADPAELAAVLASADR